MGFYGMVSSEIKLYFVIVFITCVVGQREVDISVIGNRIVKTGITHYTIYDVAPVVESFTISCWCFIPVPFTTSIVRNTTALSEMRVDNPNNNVTVNKKFSYNRDNATKLEGVYSCRFNYSLMAHNGSQLSYFLESEIYVSTTTDTEVCASSVGASGYVGEKVTLTCESSSYDLDVNFLAGHWMKSRYNLEAYLLEDGASFTCTDDRLNDHCSKEITAHQFLEVQISPTNFSLDSQVSEFVCNSTPPRLLYWVVIGNDGNILDLVNFHRSGDVRAIVNIKQSAGWSSLNITSLTANTINKVQCSTYGTRIRAAAYASSVTSKKDSCKENMNTYPPDTSTAKVASGNRTMTSAYTTQEHTSRSNIIATNTKTRQNKHGTTELRVSVAFLAVLICLSSIINIYMCYRARKQSHFEDDVTAKNVQPETSKVQDTTTSLTYYTTTVHCEEDGKVEPSYAKSILLEPSYANS